MSHCYRQLRLDERETIFRMKDARLPVGRIAEQLGRHPSTIYRELRRNFLFDEDSYFRGYYPSVAHKLASDRRAPGRKLARNLELASYVIDGLHLCWPFEQISGRLRRLLPSETDIAALDEAAINAISNRINRTPRKCLGYMTPEEVLMTQIAMHTYSFDYPTRGAPGARFASCWW